MWLCVYVLSVSFPHLFFLYIKIYLFLVVQSLSCCLGFSLLAGSGATLSLRCVGSLLCWLLLWVPGAGSAGFSICACGLSRCGAWALEHTLRSCGMCSELLPSIFPDEGWSPCLLHGQKMLYHPATREASVSLTDILVFNSKTSDNHKIPVIFSHMSCKYFLTLVFALYICSRYFWQVIFFNFDVVVQSIISFYLFQWAFSLGQSLGITSEKHSQTCALVG